MEATSSVESTRGERIALATVFLTGTAGAIVTAVKPILVTAYVSSLHFAESQAGLLVGLDMAALSFGSLLVSWRLYAWPRSRVAIAALLLIAVGNLLSLAGTSFIAMSAARLIAGLGSGIAGGMAAAAITNMPRSESRFGLYLICTLFAACVVSWLTGAVLQSQGIGAMFVVLAVLALPPILLARRFPPLRVVRTPFLSAGAPGGRRILLGTLAILVGTAIYFVAAGGTWAFLGQIGLSRGLDAATLGAVLAGAFLMGAVGASLPALLRDRLGLAAPIGLTVVVTILSLALLSASNGLPGYALAASGFLCAWNAFFPFVMGLCARFDPLGRVGALCYGVSAGAAAIGPTLAGLVIERSGIGRLLMLAMIGIPLGAGFILLACRLSRRAGLDTFGGLPAPSPVGASVPVDGVRDTTMTQARLR